MRISGGVTCTCSGWDICAPAAAERARTKTKTERERRETEARQLLEKQVLGKDIDHPQASAIILAQFLPRSESFLALGTGIHTSVVTLKSGWLSGSHNPAAHFTSITAKP